MGQVPVFQTHRTEEFTVIDGLPSNQIDQLLQLEDNYLLVATSDGIVRSKGTGPEPVFSSLYDRTDAVLFDGRRAVGMAHSKSGSVYIAFRDGVVLLKDGRFSELPLPAEFGEVEFTAFCLSANGGFYLAGRTGLYFFEGEAQARLVRRLVPGLPAVRDLFEDSDGSILVATEAGLFRLEPGGGVSERLFDGERGLRSSRVTEVLRDSSGRLWVLVGGAQPGDGAVHLVVDGALHELPLPSAVVDNSTTALMLDSEGAIWIGMAGDGMIQFRPRLIETYDQGNGFTDGIVHSVCVGVGERVWTGTRSGVFAMDPAEVTDPNEPFVHRFAEEEHRWKKQYPDVASIFESSDGRLWIGTQNGVFVHEAGEIRELAALGPEGRGSVFSITEGPEGVVYVGARGVLGVYTGDALERFPLPSPRQSIESLLWSESGYLWVGTTQGLYRFYRSPDRLERIDLGAELEHLQIKCLYPGEGDQVWAGTMDGDGVLFWDGSKVKRITTHNGLHSLDIAAIHRDQGGNIWFLSDWGMGRASYAEVMAVVRGEQERFNLSVYRELHGMLSTALPFYGQPCSWVTEAGEFWVATDRGLARFWPEELAQTDRAPSVLIEEVNANQQTLFGLPVVGNRVLSTFASENRRYQPSSEPPRCSIQPGNGKAVTIRFAAPGTISSDNTKFRYLLEGHDTEWTESMDIREAVYPVLEPGRYRFRVLAASNFGFWSREEASVVIEVLPFFYQTKLFTALCVGGVVGLILLAHGLRMRFQRHRLLVAQQAALAEDRARIAKDMHDQMGANLTQIAMLGTMAQGREGRDGRDDETLERMVDKARVVSQSMKELIWVTSPRNDTLESLLSHIGQQAIDFLSSANIRCRLEIPDDLPAYELSGWVRNHLNLAVREALHNAVKHSGASLVRVGAVVGASELILTVNDNGCGLGKAAGLDSGGREGNGLENMRRRMSDLGGEFRLRAEDGMGTVIQFVVPIEKLSGSNPEDGHREL